MGNLWQDNMQTGLGWGNFTKMCFLQNMSTTLFPAHLLTLRKAIDLFCKVYDQLKWIQIKQNAKKG